MAYFKVHRDKAGNGQFIEGGLGERPECSMGKERQPRLPISLAFHGISYYVPARSPDLLDLKNLRNGIRPCGDYGPLAPFAPQWCGRRVKTPGKPVAGSKTNVRTI